MNQVERLKVAIEEIEFLRTGCALTWKETLDEDARTLAVGFTSEANAQTLGRKLKDDEQINWEAEADTDTHILTALIERAMRDGSSLHDAVVSAKVAQAGYLEPARYPARLLTPLTPELIERYRVEILRALLREAAINTKF